MSLRTWPHESWDIGNGRHTYCGFYEMKGGIVVPDVPFNFALFPEEKKKEMREGFKRMGLTLLDAPPSSSGPRGLTKEGGRGTLYTRFLWPLLRLLRRIWT